MTFLKRYENASDLIFRLLFTLIFLGAGVKHLVDPQDIVARLLAAPLAPLATAVAPAPALVACTGVVLILGGLGLLVGLWTRMAAVALIVVLIPITVVADIGGGAATMGPLFKNIALLGGLVHFAVRGPGAFALGSWLEGQRGTRSFLLNREKV